MRSLKGQAYDALLDRLQKNILHPGEIINRRTVAKELGISVAPVLEAMLQLEAEGFLEALPRKGTRVSVVRLEDVRGHLIVREAIECEAARYYCGEPIRANRDELLKMAAEVDAAYGLGPVNWEAEIHFHQRLVELAGCRALVREFKRVMRLGLFYHLHVVMPVDQDSERSLHAPLVENLCTDDPDEAVRVIRVHMRSGKSALYAAGHESKHVLAGGKPS
jgi:DNA-binding GntR family transcriptional regulator